MRWSMVGVVVPLLLLPRCLTRQLWEDDEVTPELASTVARAEVVEARGGFGDARTRSVLGVRFRLEARKDLPRAAVPRSARRSMAVLLEPPDYADERDWRSLPGAAVFRPATWGFRITRAAYFRSAWANALVIAAGAVLPGEVGRIVPATELPADLGPRQDPRRALGPDTTDLYSRSLESAHTRAWEELLEVAATGGDWKATPLAWLDEDGAVVEPGAVRRLLEGTDDGERERAERLALLLRLDSSYGRTVHVAVRLPVLVQGPGLRLQRAGPEVRWERAQVWRVRPTTASALRALPPCDVPLESTSFEFRYLAETHPGRIGRTIGRVLLTPFTMLIDALLETSLDALLWQWQYGRRRTPRRLRSGR